jgi:hypothetical protein
METNHLRYHSFMPLFPIKTCILCGEEFELKPDKPGFANRCPDCSAEGENPSASAGSETKANRDLNEARRNAMKNLLYRKDS